MKTVYRPFSLATFLVAYYASSKLHLRKWKKKLITRFYQKQEAEQFDTVESSHKLKILSFQLHLLLFLY